MGKIKTIMILSAMIVTLFACGGVDAKASASTDGVSVTVPTNVDIVFNGDGTTSVSDMYIENNSLVPVEVQVVNVTEFNKWKVVPSDKEILVNSKQFCLSVDGKELGAGGNFISQTVAEGDRYDFNVEVGHGAWTQTLTAQKALEIEFEYEIGTKEFALHLDGNGGALDEVVYEKNGATVQLPTPEREGYLFDGWEDSKGNRYTEDYVMPIGDATLKAAWRKLTAYALYSSSDDSLTFVKTAEAIKAGQTYNGKTVTTVYTGFEENAYSYYPQVPWYADGKYKSVKHVIFEDVIKPVSTAYWFYYFEACASFDVRKLDTSQVTTMRGMYGMTGREDGISSYIITGMDTWDTSQVMDMYGMFEASAIMVSTFDLGDIGKWDVSKVKDMRRTFSSAGMRASRVYIGDLSNWDTGNVEMMSSMFSSFGYETPSVNIGDIGKWNVSNVTDMDYMFSHFCRDSASVYIGDLSSWNVGKVTDFRNMFYWSAMHVQNWNFGNLGNWDVSSGKRFDGMFCSAGNYSKTFYVGTLQNWNTANATSMDFMFEYAGANASWFLNCTNWNVKKVTSHNKFNGSVESKVIAPNWVN